MRSDNSEISFVEQTNSRKFSKDFISYWFVYGACLLRLCHLDKQKFVIVLPRKFYMMRTIQAPICHFTFVFSFLSSVASKRKPFITIVSLESTWIGQLKSSEKNAKTRKTRCEQNTLIIFCFFFFFSDFVLPFIVNRYLCDLTFICRSRIFFLLSMRDECVSNEPSEMLIDCQNPIE